MKSTNSQRINITFHDDIWKLYEKNREDMDYIFGAVCSKFQNIEPDEMKDEILLLLHSREALSQYDPSKGARLHTWLTWKIRGYAHHVYDKMGSRKVYHVDEDGNKTYWRRKLAQGINSRSRKIEEGELMELSSEDNIEGEILFGEFLELVPESERSLFRTYLEGFNWAEISRMLGISKTGVKFHVCKARDAVALLREELING